MATISIVSLGSVQSPVDIHRYEYTSFHMGTQLRLILYAQNAEEGRGAAAAVFARVEELEQILSDYREDSELSRLSSRSGGPPRVVSFELFTVLSRALEFSRLSNGLFDVTVKPLVRLWKKAIKEGSLPDAEQLERARSRTGFQFVELDPSSQTVRLTMAGMELDLGGIAKGFAADQALEVLRARDIDRALIDFGGDLRAGDPPPEKLAWKIRTLSGCEIYLDDQGAAGSGSNHQVMQVDGVRYSHLISPINGSGKEIQRSVVVIAEDGTTADAIATTVALMDRPQAERFVAGLKGVRLIFSAD